jgi:hypothetical protein
MSFIWRLKFRQEHLAREKCGVPRAPVHEHDYNSNEELQTIFFGREALCGHSPGRPVSRFLLPFEVNECVRDHAGTLPFSVA